MLCESYSQRIGQFHQNEIVLIICHLSSLTDNHIEEAERLNMNAIKTERTLAERHPGETKGSSFWFDIYLYCLTKISIQAKRSISLVFSLFIVPSPFFCTLPVQRPY